MNLMQVTATHAALVPGPRVQTLAVIKCQMSEMCREWDPIVGPVTDFFVGGMCLPLLPHIKNILGNCSKLLKTLILKLPYFGGLGGGLEVANLRKVSLLTVFKYITS